MPRRNLLSNLRISRRLIRRTIEIVDDEIFELEFKRAAALRDTGRFDEASEIMERLVAERPGNKAALLGLLSVYYLAENFVEALRVSREAVGVAPRSELASVTPYFSLLHNGFTDEAEKEMARFLALRPESPEYRRVKEELSETREKTKLQ
jgi:tetratricopeptide (TPR) repeat protein